MGRVLFGLVLGLLWPYAWRLGVALWAEVKGDHLPNTKERREMHIRTEV